MRRIFVLTEDLFCYQRTKAFMKRSSTQFLYLTLMITLSACQNCTGEANHQLNPNLSSISSGDRENIKIALEYANEENVDELCEAGELKIITFGIVSNDYSEFEKKYGIIVKTEGCMAAPHLLSAVADNNLAMADFLTKRYGDAWKTDLGFIPLGIN